MERARDETHATDERGRSIPAENRRENIIDGAIINCRLLQGWALNFWLTAAHFLPLIVIDF
jgi:hypothetical protein